MQQIIKSKDITQDLEKAVKNMHHDRLFILVDENTNSLCYPILDSSETLAKAQRIVIPAGDTHKTLETMAAIWKQLTENGATRHSLLINLGGGMITDMGGFAAATFKRGIACINVPTTLLGAVDAAVGGKTGINFDGYKNEIGAFYSAKLVFLSSAFFNTLSKTEILSGYAEMIKHSLIHSQTDWDKLLAFSFDAIDYEMLNELSFRSVSIKQRIVEKDPYEKDIRKALNLGHTVSHAFESFAIEKNSPVPHGYAVAWGLIAELYLSYRLCDFPKEKLQKTVSFVQKHYGAFPVSCDNYETLYEIMTHDKKNENSAINFTLLSDIGNVKINQNVEKKMIFEALDFYRDSVGL
ncbi:MAG: 3-dehydroquinate synthase [Dysgonamonadaceae bacterium]|jgi:3-dehydroquinate synthase|nr:3-dehydroquinate synthase [Dysgonamonadaceae bacterium]